ncbi:Uncharacterised protein [Vibrio cholerae]|uniref:Uncharacterized protein n=1 Tax=Vibrio cholerae TaxID=666 RepID=A0A656AHC1_VIBCL|nr:Uncharacterised protein [Vibrio cholerae]CSC48429.1 Uncharacterised protein [Vibrio cholerae]CSD15199.1 Uncharacterised protein [Vibrio cholerae]
MVRTIIDTIKLNAIIGKVPVHPLGERNETLFAKFATRNTGLVGNQHQQIPHTLQSRSRFKYTFNKLEIVLIMHVTMIDVDHAITIKKYGGFGQNAVSFKSLCANYCTLYFFHHYLYFFRHYLITFSSNYLQPFRRLDVKISIDLNSASP